MRLDLKLVPILTLLAVLLSVSACWRSADSDTEFVVGLLAPKIGVMAGHGESMEMGAAIAVAQLNEEGGVNGQAVKLVVLDTQSDPGVAAQRAREIIGRNKANIVLGTGLSSETLAVIPITTDAGVPFIYSMDGELKTCAIGDSSAVSNAVWGAGFTERMIVEPFLKELRSNVLDGAEDVKVYFLGGDYVYPRSTNEFARSVAEEMGFQVVGEEYVDVSTTDYTPVIRRISSSNANLLIVTNPGSAAAIFMRQALQLGLDQEVAITGFATFAQEAVAEMGDVSQGALYANRYSDLLENPQNEAFVERFRKAYPEKTLLPGPTVAAGSYGTLMIAADAYRRAGRNDDLNLFREAMNTADMQLPQGRVQVNPENQIFDQHMYLLVVNNQKYEVLADLGMQSHPGLAGCSVP